ncbi:hypothetical protein ACOMHN_019478 [Nucella lapillus]
MELKVWVDGIPRVVSGATYDTTCQDVVVALAYAMDRTGTFTLTERWRNSNRPLTPEEYPLQALQKWGEYAPEVQFVLCQANTEDSASKEPNKDKSAKKMGGLLAFSHQLKEPLKSSTAGHVSVKRSLTFSGAHHNHLPQRSVASSSAPVSKLRKTQRGPVPNGDVQELSSRSACAPHPSSQPLPKQQRRGGGGTQQPSPQPRTAQHPPVPSPRHRATAQPPPHQVKENIPSGASASSQDSSNSGKNAVSSSSRDSFDGGKNTVSSHKPLPAARSHHPVTPVSASASSHAQSDSPPSSHFKSESRSRTSPRPPQSQSQSEKLRRELQSDSPTSSQQKSESRSRTSPRLLPPQSQSEKSRQELQSDTPLSSQQKSESRSRTSPRLPQPPSHSERSRLQSDTLLSSQQKSESRSSTQLPQPQAQSEKARQEFQSDATLFSQHKSEARTSPRPIHLQSQSEKSKQELKSFVPLQTQQTSSTPNISESPPPLPTSPPPVVRRMGPQQRPSSVSEEVEMDELCEVSPNHSRRASLEIEEYDLEHSFLDPHQECSHTERPSVSLEYRLDEGMGSGSRSGSRSEGQLDREHARLLQLVSTLEEQLKSQESQIGLINTEITALEEKEKEYEEKLHVTMEDLLLHENRQKDLELQLNDLEKVEWNNVLDGEKKCDNDLTLQIAATKASILDFEEKMTEARTKEEELLGELKEEEEKLNQEKERLKAEETKVREEEEKTKEEISKLWAVFTEETKKTTDVEASLSTIETELKTVEKILTEKERELREGEAKLKDKNFKDFVTHPAPKEESQSMNTGETVLKILEARLSPRPPAGAFNKTGPDSPRPSAFIATLTASSQSDVWV